MSGAGYGDGDRISEEDQRRWANYEMPSVGSFERVVKALEASDKQDTELARSGAGCCNPANDLIDIAVENTDPERACALCGDLYSPLYEKPCIACITNAERPNWSPRYASDEAEESLRP